MEFKDSRTAEFFEAAMARGDTEAIILQLIVTQVALINCLPVPLKDKIRLIDGLGLIIDGFSSGFIERNQANMQNIGRQLDADRADIFASRR